MKLTYGSYDLYKAGKRLNYVKLITKYPKPLAAVLRKLTTQPVIIKDDATYVQVTK